MKLHQVSRNIHYWGAILCAVPLMIVLATGILLLLKKQIPWIQPPTQHVEQVAMVLSPTDMLRVVDAMPNVRVDGWEDIDRIDIRPQKGIAKVITTEHVEVQLDLNTGAVLQIANRRSDWIESLHDGSYFGDSIKYMVFLPTAVILFLLWITGVYLFFLPFYRRAQKTRR